MSLRRAATTLSQRVLGSLSSAESQLGADLLAGAGFEQVRHASNQAVKQRIRAIKNIAKITKAMKMVAASKMRNAQSAVMQSRGLVDPFLRLVGDHPAVSVPKGMTIAVTSDRGLCGGLNTNVIKYTKAVLKTTEGETHQEEIVTIGDKGRALLQRVESDRMVMTCADTYKERVTFPQASLIAEDILKRNPEAVRILYNKFWSAISFKPTIATVLTAETVEKQLNEGGSSKLDAYEVEATNEVSDTLKDLAEFQLAATLYNAMLENNCSEHASRMSAMENSTKSAGEMLGNLTLAYNRKRQATITTELIEIIAGASALVDAE